MTGDSTLRQASPRGTGTPLTDDARRFLERRYLRRDRGGRVVETPDEMFDRVAGAVAAAEARWDEREETTWREAFREALGNLEFLPNTPTLMNAGTEDGQLSACYVLPVPDTTDGVAAAAATATLVQRSGGGTGFSFSDLPPPDGVRTDPESWGRGPLAALHFLDGVTKVVGRVGRRRGANMGMLRVDHPDLLDFVHAKERAGVLSNFNLSVAVTDAFMEAVERDDDWVPRRSAGGTVASRVKARTVFGEIAHLAWLTADPGVVFIDAIAEGNPTPHLGSIEATNPCGEVPLLPFESCNLGSINLARVLVETGGRPAIDWPRLRALARLALRFLDDAIELNRFPTPSLDEAAHRTRKTGVGVMGLAETFARLGIPYASREATVLAEEVMRQVAEECRTASRELARVRGVFPAWEGSVPAAQGDRVRNAARTSIAPTGSISLIADTTPGIEPFFALAFRRRRAPGEPATEHVEKVFVDWVHRHAADPEAVLSRTLETGRVPPEAALPPEARALFATAHDVPWRAHLAMQAAFQRWTDNAVSKTVNLPEATPEEEVVSIFATAWRLRLKGVTVFRHGCQRATFLEPGLVRAEARCGAPL